MKSSNMFPSGEVVDETVALMPSLFQDHTPIDTVSTIFFVP
jgi:hypothetical protein